MESFILAKGPVFKPWLYLRFFVVVVFFFHVREGHYALLRAFSYENEVL